MGSYFANQVELTHLPRVMNKIVRSYLINWVTIVLGWMWSTFTKTIRQFIQLLKVIIIKDKTATSFFSLQSMPIHCPLCKSRKVTCWLTVFENQCEVLMTTRTNIIGFFMYPPNRFIVHWQFERLSHGKYKSALACILDLSHRFCMKQINPVTNRKQTKRYVGQC